MFKAVGQQGAVLEKSMASAERMVGKAASSSIQHAKTAADAEIAQLKRVADFRAKELGKMGLADNSAGRAIDPKTGRFASSDANLEIESRMKMLNLTDQQIALDRMRSINTQRDYAASIAGSKTLNGTLAAERATKQSMLDQVFKATDRNPWAKFGHAAKEAFLDVPPVKSFAALGRFTAKIEELGPSARYAFQDVATSATVAGVAIASFGVASIAAAVSHERSFANVARTTQTSTEGYAVLQRQLETMAMTLPVTFTELTDIASAAGQLGISSGGVAKFTETVAMLSATTNLTSDAAGTAIARFKAFFAEAKDPSLAVTEKTFGNLASSILKVGVNSIATETGIVNVSTQISSMGQYAGFTANQVIGLAGALSSVGVAPELARGITTRMFTLMGNAVSEGGVKLNTFAKLSGVSASEFQTAWGTEAMAPLFTQFLMGLNNMKTHGEDANKALMDMGLTAVRDRPVWLRLANAANEAGEAGGLLTQTMEDAYQGWIQNTELQTQYAKISETTAARIQVLGQSFEQLLASLGKGAGAGLGNLASLLTDIIKGFEAFASSPAGEVFGNLAVGASLLVGGLLLVIGGVAGTMASIQSMGQAWKTMGDIGETSFKRVGAAGKAAGAALGIMGIVASVVMLVGSFIAMDAAAKDAARGVQDFDGLVTAMKADGVDAVGNSILFTSEATAGLSDEAKAARSQAKGMATALYGVGSSSGDAAAGLNDVKMATEQVNYAFQGMAKEFYRAELMQNDTFKGLFKTPDPKQVNNWRGFGNDAALAYFDGLGASMGSVDWDRVMEESVKPGGDYMKAFTDDFKNQMKAAGNESATGLVVTGEAFSRLAKDIDKVFGGTSQEVRNMINMQEALAGNTVNTASQMIDEYEKIDEATQKVVDSMAGGFAKFVDTSSLIGLTQKMLEVGDDAEESAEAYKKAWEDAYGGTSFKLEDYMSNFRGAAEEQKGFIDNLATLTASGLISDGILQDLAAMGPEANRLVQALVDDLNTTGGAGLEEFSNLWGQTGMDSVVKMATSMAVGQAIITEVMNQFGQEGLAAFNAQLMNNATTEEALHAIGAKVKGTPLEYHVGEFKGVDEASAKALAQAKAIAAGEPIPFTLTSSADLPQVDKNIDLIRAQAVQYPVQVPLKANTAQSEIFAKLGGLQDNANSNPVQAPIKADSSNSGISTKLNDLRSTAFGSPIIAPIKASAADAGLAGLLAGLQGQANRNPITIPVRTAQGVGGGGGTTGYASGGYTGPGGKWDPAGIVHRGEFVMDAKSTSAIGVSNLYAMMRGARGERAVSRGYANGGGVQTGRSNFTGGAVSLTLETIQQIGMVMDKVLLVNGQAIGRTATQSFGSDNHLGEY